jgi:phosphohistidine phosphatase
MTRLYLFRHGVAAPHGTPGLEDDDRPLTEKGERRVRQVARGLKKTGLKLEKIITSPLPRAAKSAEIVADVLNIAYLIEDDEILRPTTEAGAIRDWITTRGETRIMLVGHNPNLSELLALLTTGKTHPTVVELRKGGVAALRDDPTGSYQIDWITRPRLIRRLGN